jgi:iron complex outermembrane recepter protein
MKTTLTATLIGFWGLTSMAQSIQGTVSNPDGTPEPGVNVVVEGTYSGTFTDANGEFRLRTNAKDSVTLRFSAIGLRAEQLRVLPSDPAPVSIVMQRVEHQLDEVITRATRADRTTATTYSELDRKEIEKRSFGQDMPFILDQEPNVVVNSDAGAGVGYTGIRIRGSDPTRINVTINGIPINDSESHGTFWVNMPDIASSTDNIQIQRGVGTSTNGAAAFGASINMQTSTLKRDPYATITNGFGSFNTWRHTLEAGTGLIADRFSVDARLSKIASDGYIDRATSDLKSFYVSGAYHGKKSLLRLNVFSGKERTYQAWYGTPESRISGNVDAMNAFIDRNGLSPEQADNLLNSGRTYNFYTYENEVDDYQQDHYQLLFSHEIMRGWDLNIAGHYTRGRGFFEQFRNRDRLSNYNIDPIIIGGDTITRTDLVRRRWLDNHFYGTTFSLDYTRLKRFSATFGGGWNQYIGDHFGELIWMRVAGTTDLGDRYYENQAVKNDLHFYLKANYVIAKGLNAFVDLQYRRIDYRFDGPVALDGQPITVLNQDINWNFFNPKAGLNYDIDSRNRVYASFAVANREPVRDDLTESSPESRPRHEQLYNTEVGYQRQGDRYRLGANVYWMHYIDQLVLTGQVNDVGGYTRQNVPLSDRYGLEIYGSWDIVRRLTWNANASFSQNKIREFTEAIDDFDNGGQVLVVHRNTDIAFSPNIVLSSELAYNPISTLNIAFITKYVGEQYLDNTSNKDRTLSPWLVNNVRLSYEFKFKPFKGIALAVQLNNITNELYEANGYTFSYIAGGETVTENFFYPQAGFNFMTMLTVKF